MNDILSLDIKKFERRKRILISNTLFSWAGYLFVGFISIMIPLLGIGHIPYNTTLSFIAFLTIVIIITIIIIVRKKIISSRFMKNTTMLLFFILYISFTAWLFTVGEMRVIGLFLASGALSFQLSTLSLTQSFFYTLAIGISYISVSYISIAILKQPGSLTTEIFYTLAFIPIVFYISYLSGRFQNQNKNLKNDTKLIKNITTALFKEIETAKNIQEKLIPQTPVIPGYSIVTHLKPAAEVGGDYYDIIKVNDIYWIIIGDVSGHGVSAGLIMMMVQTTIHTALILNPKLKPSELLSIVNSIISHNIRLLGNNKYMTLIAIAAYENGYFHFSGLHQDIMIYRAETKSVETIETEGMLLGIYDFIHNIDDEKSFTLNKNDVLLLYTDGLIEAWEKDSIQDARDPQKQMFGEKKLLSILSSSGKESSQNILNMILSELEKYSCTDDVAILILKKEE